MVKRRPANCLQRVWPSPGVLEVSGNDPGATKKTKLIMKTSLALSALTLAAGLLLSGTPNTIGADSGSARGGAGDLVKRAPAKVTAASATVPAHCEKARQDCPSCRTVEGVQSVPEGKMNAVRILPVQKHLCAACQTKIESKGHGKAQQQTVSHTCKMPSAALNACCAK